MGEVKAPTLEDAKKMFPRLSEDLLLEAIETGLLYVYGGAWVVDDLMAWQQLFIRLES